MIFDEIDTGISGKMALVVSEKNGVNREVASGDLRYPSSTDCGNGRYELFDFKEFKGEHDEYYGKKAQ